MTSWAGAFAAAPISNAPASATTAWPILIVFPPRQCVLAATCTRPPPPVQRGVCRASIANSIFGDASDAVVERLARLSRPNGCSLSAADRRYQMHFAVGADRREPGVLEDLAVDGDGVALFEMRGQGWVA